MHEELNINNFLVILNHNKSIKSVRIESYLNHGFMNENKNNAGISHLMEHIACNGWEKCGKYCSEYWKKKGCVSNASTTQSNVNYFIKGLKQYTDEMLDYIINITINPIIKNERIKFEKKAVHNELLIHKQHPQINAYNDINKLLYKNEGLIYQDNIDHQIKLLKKFTSQQLKNWTKKYYSPGNVIFIISGGFNKKKTISLCEQKLKKFNSVPKINYPLKNIFKDGFYVKHSLNKNIDNTTIFFVFHFNISYSNKEYHCIDFIEKFINSEATSYLMFELREKLNKIYNIDIEKYNTPNETLLCIEISTKNKNIEIVVEKTIEILKNISNGKFPDNMLTSVKNSYITEYEDNCKNNEFLSIHYGEQYISQLHNKKKSTILCPSDVLKLVKNMDKTKFISISSKIFNFSNLKIVYQGKRKVPNLHTLVQHKI
jgi:predicted Zn-dependent peptidase